MQADSAAGARPAGDASERPAWVVGGDGRDGPWTDAAYLDHEAALARCLSIGLEWRDEGLDVDTRELLASVRDGSSYSPREGISVGLLPISVHP